MVKMAAASFRLVLGICVVVIGLVNTQDQTTVSPEEQESTESPAAQETNEAPQVPGVLPLAGTWYNELGSVMRLTQAVNGNLVGSYSTAVESAAGAAGTIPANLYGHSNVNLTENPTFGFTVRWPGSTSVFGGQYYYENNKESLLTTWLLVSKVAHTGQQWMSTRVGTNRFYRHRQVDVGTIN